MLNRDHLGHQSQRTRNGTTHIVSAVATQHRQCRGEERVALRRGRSAMLDKRQQRLGRFKAHILPLALQRRHNERHEALLLLGARRLNGAQELERQQTALLRLPLVSSQQLRQLGH
jgi:hypothetical protein